MKITGNFGGDALKRQLTESVMIQDSPSDEILNGRDEWHTFSYHELLSVKSPITPPVKPALQVT